MPEQPPPYEEPQPVNMLVTCHTEGCPVADVTYQVPMYPNVEPPTYRAVCAQCEQYVTDIVPA
ncbi:hypothetical protein [Streptomyces sp. NPDC021356]|uniref:hypothetical protein n=1 Tax=Streptomyces sp. NPDC021356 TaxID=3154900 RepID=UPI0033E2F722